MVKLPPPENKSTVDLIYETYEKANDEKERIYLGCSTFGTDCERAHWYQFRWANEGEKFSGRMLRLFQTGHREEARMIEDLRSVGIGIDSKDENGEQIGVSGVGGHLKGHLDGLAHNLPEAPKTDHLLECKTHNDKSYRDLLINRVKKSKPGHYRQMQLYMGLIRLDRALYIAHNKNDDSLYIERVKFDPVAFRQLMKRAERVISSNRAPEKINESPEFYICQWCPSKGVCHEGDFARRNCRTCIDATPAMDGDGRWTCDYWRKDLTTEEQKRGCPKHIYLPSLVPGVQTDADAEKRTVTYVLDNGDIWIDGGENDL